MNTLIRKGMPNIYLKVTVETSSKLRFFKFKKFFCRSALGELQLTQISLNFKTSCCNLKIGVKLCVWLFYYFNFEKYYAVLKSKGPYFLLNKNINFDKNEMESKMKNPTHPFREMNLVLQFI